MLCRQRAAQLQKHLARTPLSPKRLTQTCVPQSPTRQAACFFYTGTRTNKTAHTTGHWARRDYRGLGQRARRRDQLLLETLPRAAKRAYWGCTSAWLPEQPAGFAQVCPTTHADCKQCCIRSFPPPPERKGTIKVTQLLLQHWY